MESNFAMTLEPVDHENRSYDTEIRIVRTYYDCKVMFRNQILYSFSNEQMKNVSIELSLKVKEQDAKG